MPSQGKCNRCGRQFIWAVVEATGKSIPVDPEPGKGNVILTRRTQHGRVPMVIARMVGPEYVLAPGEQRRTSHLASCPARELDQKANDEQRARRFGGNTSAWRLKRKPR